MLAAPTPAVTAVSRRRPRRLSIDGGTEPLPGLLGIGIPSFLAGPACWSPATAGPAAELVSTMPQPVE
jgi:hypothetical protein